ncbi:MAG: PEP-CTERM sorting domain-containing protein [Myxococcota bacterium]|nr:PEP-CTERM sorting domain-containing protein [Myxococcales bacterium]
MERTQKNTKRVWTMLVAAIGTITPALAHATIMAQTGPRDFAEVVASDAFQSGNCIFRVCNRAGFISSLPDDATAFFAQVVNLNGVTGIYPNGGADSMISIRLNVAGRDGFGQFQLDVSNAAGIGTGDPQYVWLRAYNDGMPTGFDFDFDVTRPTTLTIWSEGGSVFDEIRVQSYTTAAIRDLHVETTAGGAIVGAFFAGEPLPVPEPGTAALMGLGLALLATRSGRGTQGT